MSASRTTTWVDARVRDCLGISWSYLSMNDFARVIRCNKVWHAVGRRNTAWPRMSMEVVSSLIFANDYAATAARRISVNVNRTRSRRGLMRTRHNPILSKIEDLHIWTSGGNRYDDAALTAVSHLPRLKMLNLGLNRPSHQAVRECFTRLAPTLECLLSNVPQTAVVASLSLLTCLQVLVIRIDRSQCARVHLVGQGPASLLATALPVLTMLHALHYEDSHVLTMRWSAPVVLQEGQERALAEAEAFQVVTAVRDLSAHHALRQVSFRWRGSQIAYEHGIFDLTPLATPHCRLNSLQLDMAPTILNLASVSRLPALVTLEWLCSLDLLADEIDDSSLLAQQAQPMPPCSSSLRSLRLRNLCTEPQSLSLCRVMKPGVLPYLIALAPELEELRLSHVHLRTNDWFLLPQWSRLRVLYLQEALELSSSQIHMLRRWPSWQVIHLNPARRGTSSSCGCHWRLVRRKGCDDNYSHCHSHNDHVFLIQDAPLDADQHDHASCEHQLTQ